MVLSQIFTSSVGSPTGFPTFLSSSLSYCPDSLGLEQGAELSVRGEAPLTHHVSSCRLSCPSPCPQRWGWRPRLWAHPQGLLRLGRPLFP